MHHKPEKIVIFAASAHALKMNRYIDTHTHLYDEMFSEDADAAVRRALDAGVTQMIFPDIDASSRGAMMDLAAGFPGHIHTCLGLHPTSVDGKWRENLEEIEGMLDSRTVAIGETGMDCYWSTDFVKEQEEAFEWQVRLACREGLPVIIHSREAEEDTIALLEQEADKNLCGVLHCFSSQEKLAQAGLELGFYISASGIITFKSADQLRNIFKSIPVERLLLETDAPYLAPVPYRGKTNEPSFIIKTAEVLAGLKQMTLDQMKKQTTQNFFTLFSKAF